MKNATMQNKVTMDKVSINKGIARNLIATITSFGINILISFFLTRHVVNKIGVEANGFVALGNNIIQYVNLIAISLNSMAARFIMVESERKHQQRAEVYYKSVLFSNIVLSAIVTIPSVFFISYLQNIINIPASIILDVKILFSLLIINFVVSLISNTYAVCYFITNTLYISSIRDVIGNVIKAIVLVIAFSLFSPSVWYVGLAAFVASIFAVVYNFVFNKKLTHSLFSSKAKCELSAIKVLFSSGIWNLVVKLGQILTDGLDLLIADIMISSTSMGVLSVAKTIPIMIQSIIGSIASSYVPSFTSLYTSKDIEGLVHLLKSSMKLLAFIMSIPLGILFMFGIQFFQLWVPAQDASQLQILSILSIMPLIISGSVNTVFNIFTVTNKLKVNSIALLISGIINTAIVFVLLSCTDFGIYAVAGVSSFVIICKNLFVVLPYAAKCLKRRWSSFYPDILWGIITTCVIVACGACVNCVPFENTWGTLILKCIIVGACGTFINFFILFRKNERKNLVMMLIRSRK